MSKKAEIQKVNDEKVNQLVKFMKDNSGWIIGILTFFGLIILKILELIEHLTSETFFNYYGLNHNLYNYEDKGFIYELVISIVFLLSMFSIFMAFEQIKEKIKNKKILNFENLLNILLVFLSNIFIEINISEKLSIHEIIFLILTELIISFFFRKSIEKIDKKNKKQLKKILFNYVKVLPCLIIILLVTNSIRVCLKLKMEKEYNIINNNKVIVYTTKDYYLTLDCEIVNGNELKIHRGKQEKIDNNNVKAELIEFDKVEIINKPKQ